MGGHLSSCNLPPTGESQRFFTLLPVEGATDRGGVRIPEVLG